MNCEEAQRQVLLADSGEISARAAGGLALHLAACASCRELREALGACTAAARRAAPDRHPAPAVMAAVRREACDLPARHLVWFPTPALKTLSYAALLALLFGGAMLLRPDAAPEMHSILAVLSDEATGDADTSSAAEGVTRLQTLGRAILELEDSRSGELVMDAFPSEVSSPSGAEPTVLRSRSTGGLPQKRRV